MAIDLGGDLIWAALPFHDNRKNENENFTLIHGNM